MNRTLAVGWAVVLWAAWIGGASAQAPVTTAPAASNVQDAALDSPRSTIQTFLQAMARLAHGDETAWPVVEQVLDSAALAPQSRRDAALQLYEVFDRVGIEPGDLPDAPMLAPDGPDAPPVTRWLVFPRRAHAWVWEKLGHAPRGRIVLSADETGRWRFDEATIAGAAELYESVRDLPPKVDATLPGDEDEQVLSVLGPTFDRTPWWGWFSLFAGIFLGLLAGKLLQNLLKPIAARLEARGYKARAIAIEDALGPIGLAAITTGIVIGLRFVHMEPAVADLSHRIIAFLYLVAIGWLLYNLVDVVDVAIRTFTPQNSTKIDQMVVPLIRKTLRIFLIIVFTLAVAQNIFGLDITGWLAGLGIAGLAVSLAAQDSVKNIFGSIIVLMDKPFSVGDFIHFDGEDAVVEEIGFRSTKMRTPDGHVITVPNMKFNDQKVRNIAARRAIRRVINVTITYDTPPDKVEQAVQIIKDILADPAVAAPMDEQLWPSRVFFSDFNADSLNLKVYYWYTLRDGRDFWTYNAHAMDFNLRLFRAFADAGIEFAFPTQTLFLAGDPARPLNLAAPTS